MAFIATAPLVQAVCKAGGMRMLGAAANPPTCCKRRSATSKQQTPDVSGSISIARFSVIEHIEVNAALGEVLRWL